MRDPGNEVGKLLGMVEQRYIRPYYVAQLCACCPVSKVSARLLAAIQRFNKERFQLMENLRSARRSPFVISKVLAARMRKLITARARKNKRTACMLANARKDHSIPLHSIFSPQMEANVFIILQIFFATRAVLKLGNI